MIQLLVLAKKAVIQNAASAIPASPKVACVQAFTPSQCGWSAIPRKNGTCQYSHARLSRNEKARILNSGVPDRSDNQPVSRKIFTLLSSPLEVFCSVVRHTTSAPARVELRREDPTRRRDTLLRPGHNLVRLSRSALVTTDTELSAMAAPAKIGESRSPKAGYSTPAATGMPSAL